MPKQIVGVTGVAPKKGQLPAGLVRWLKANGRMKRGGATMAKATKPKAVKTTRARKPQVA